MQNLRRRKRPSITVIKGDGFMRGDASVAGLRLYSEVRCHTMGFDSITGTKRTSANSTSSDGLA